MTSGFFLGDNRWVGLLRMFIMLILPVVSLITNFFASLLYGYSFSLGIFLLIYVFLLISAIATSVHYLKDIYQIGNDSIPFRYFMACFFGLITPSININQEQQGSDEQLMVEKIGGPAYLKIDPGFVVLTETLTEPGKVHGHGTHFMSRHERIYDIVDLREQEGMINNVTAVTQDGIQVMVENIKFNYRIWDSRWEHLYNDTSITRNPYPYTKKAIYDHAYKRPVKLNKQDQPELTAWEDAVMGPIIGILKTYISEHKLDDVIAPREQEKYSVREEIRKKAFENGVKDGLRGIGTILRWWDPGEFSTQEEEVEKQFISNWSVEITNDINLNKAHGDAQKMAYEELGRAEAEAELLMSIIHALDDIQLGKDKVQTLQNLILLRTAQVIKAFNIHPEEETKKKTAKG